VSRVLCMSADHFPGRAVSKLRVDRLAFALGGLRPLRFRPGRVVANPKPRPRKPRSSPSYVRYTKSRFMIRTRAGSQPGHTFPEPGGNRSSREDTLAALFEFRRTLEEQAGPLRTRRRYGSGPVRPRGSNSSSPWVYIQSEALQGVTVHLGPAEFVHLKKIRGRRRSSARWNSP
jgi:hypothetical protein